MGFEKEALELFLTNDYNEAKIITERLNKYNQERQQIEKKIYDEAVKMIEKSEKDKKTRSHSAAACRSTAACRLRKRRFRPEGGETHRELGNAVCQKSGKPAGGFYSRHGCFQRTGRRAQRRAIL